MIVPIEKSINTISSGFQYAGHLTINGTIFQYDLSFENGLSNDERKEVYETENQVRDYYQIVVRRSGQKIVLSNAEYFFLLNILVRFAVQHYYSNENGPLQETVLYPLSQRQCERLNQEKFGCSIPLFATV